MPGAGCFVKAPGAYRSPYCVGLSTGASGSGISVSSYPVNNNLLWIAAIAAALEAAAAAAMDAGLVAIGIAGLEVLGAGAARGIACNGVLAMGMGAAWAADVNPPKGIDMPGCAPEAKARLKAATSALSSGSGALPWAVLAIDVEGFGNGVAGAAAAGVVGRANGRWSACVTSKGLAGLALVLLCGGKLNKGAGALATLPPAFLEERAWGDRPNNGAGALAVPPDWLRVMLLLITVS